MIGFLDLNALGGPRAGVIDAAPFGIGAHPGVRAELTIPVVADLSFEADYNFGSRGYVPRYFDRLYFLERDRMFGSTLPKSTAVAPASHGYNLNVTANVLKTLSFYVEARDQIPFFADEGTNSAIITAGAGFFALFFGANATLSQAGIREYLAPGLFGAGFIFTAEGRVALFANVVHLVGRYYRVHEPHDIDLLNRDYDVLEGTLVGLEINFDLNTPFPM
jgi:hypothetical protein